MHKTKQGRGPGFFSKYGAAVALALAALLLISASAAFVSFTGTVRGEVAGETASNLASLRDAVVFGAKTRAGDMTQALSAAAGYVESDGGAPGGDGVTAGLAAMSTDALSFSYETPDLLTGMSEYLGESRSRLEEKLASGDLAGILINYPGFPWEYTLFAARGVYRGTTLTGVVCCASDASALFAAGSGETADAVLLVTADGHLVPSNAAQLAWAGEHGYSLLDAGSGLSERARGTLKAGLADAKTGIVSTGGGYVAFAPLDVNGWNVVTVFENPAAVVNSRLDRSAVYAGAAAVLLAAAIAVLGVLVYREVRRARRIRDARYAALSDFTDKVFFEYDLTNRELVFTPNVRRAIPSLASNVLSLRDEKHAFHHVHPEDTDNLRRAIRRAAEEPIEDFRLRVRVRNSQYETFSLRTALLPDASGRIAAVMGELANLTGKEHLSESLSSPANIDALTGMPNYNGVRLRMERLIADNQGGALLVIDLNNFAAVNELHGKGEGDELLRRISRAIAKTFRRDDVVGRTGGDEFTVYMIGAEEYGIVAKKTEVLIENMERIEGLSKDVHVTASIGIAFSPYDGATYEDLSKAANTAMSVVKNENAAAYRFFSSGDLPAHPGDEA